MNNYILPQNLIIGTSFIFKEIITKISKNRNNNKNF